MIFDLQNALYVLGVVGSVLFGTGILIAAVFFLDEINDSYSSSRHKITTTALLVVAMLLLVGSVIMAGGFYSTECE